MIAVLLAATLAAAHPQMAAPSSLPSAPGGKAEAPDQVAKRYGLAGELLIAKGGKVLVDRGYGPIAPNGSERHKAGERWRLASITKQIVATLVVQRSLLALDAPLGGMLPELGTLTLRQLLTHHSGLANPDDTPSNVSGVPSFYTGNPPDLSYCTSKPGVPGSAFHYNNCDYLLAGASLFVDPSYPDGVWPKGMAMARSGEMGVPGYVGGKPEPHYEVASFGAAGGLMGTVRAVFDFDRELMTGQLLPPASLAELWKPEGNGSYQALGQWVFPGRLKGCAAPKRIVQRDGEIGGVQARNFIFPDDDLVVIVFTNRSSDDFPLGEVWQGQGFAYDLLSAAVC